MSSFSDEDLQKLADLLGNAIREQRTNNPCDFCHSTERRQSHREDHEFIKGLKEAAEMWENIRVDLLRDVLKWATRIILSALVIGLIVLAKRYYLG